MLLFHEHVTFTFTVRQPFTHETFRRGDVIPSVTNLGGHFIRSVGVKNNRMRSYVCFLCFYSLTLFTLIEISKSSSTVDESLLNKRTIGGNRRAT